MMGADQAIQSNSLAALQLAEMFAILGIVVIPLAFVIQVRRQ